MPADFAQRFCASFSVDPANYRHAMLARTLYPAARVLRLVLLGFNADYFAPDLDFIDGIGRATQRRSFVIEMHEYAHHPANRGFFRQTLRLRVSVRRAQRVFDTVFPPSPQATPPAPEAPAGGQSSRLTASRPASLTST